MIATAPVSSPSDFSSSRLSQPAFSPSSPKIHPAMSPLERAIKRLFDIVCGCVSMVVFSPLCLLIWAAIRLEDGGPAIFRQQRIGYRGKAFMLYKFRSMKVTSESDGRPSLCQKDDDRLTRVGAFIRAHHLDEFPQLWNVVKGDMSFVGPRPERRYFINRIMHYNPDYELLYQLRPGLFSKATLYNGYTDTMEKMLTRLDMDLDYLAHCSLWLDLKIIFLTAASIFLGKKF